MLEWVEQFMRMLNLIFTPFIDGDKNVNRNPPWDVRRVSKALNY